MLVLSLWARSILLLLRASIPLGLLLGCLAGLWILLPDAAAFIAQGDSNHRGAAGISNLLPFAVVMLGRVLLGVAAITVSFAVLRTVLRQAGWLPNFITTMGISLRISYRVFFECMLALIFIGLIGAASTFVATGAMMVINWIMSSNAVFAIGIVSLWEETKIVLPPEQAIYVSYYQLGVLTSGAMVALAFIARHILLFPHMFATGHTLRYSRHAAAVLSRGQWLFVVVGLAPCWALMVLWYRYGQSPSATQAIVQWLNLGYVLIVLWGFAWLTVAYEYLKSKVEPLLPHLPDNQSAQPL